MKLADLPDDHQHADIDRAVQRVTRRGLAIDAGAHRGITTKRLLEYFSEVVSIEPSELADQIQGATVIRAAISGKEGRCSMQHGHQNTGQRHVVEGDDVKVTTIDAIDVAPDFIKMDVEGLEYHALLGAEKTIKKYKPVIMLEDNGLSTRYGVERGACQKLLESWGATLDVSFNRRRCNDQLYVWL